MTKQSLIWLGIRVVGMVFSYLAIDSAIKLVWTIFSMSDYSRTVNMLDEPLIRSASSPLTSFVWMLGAYAVLFGTGAIYLLIDGRIVFNLLNNEGTEPESDLETLHLSE